MKNLKNGIFNNLKNFHTLDKSPACKLQFPEEDFQKLNKTIVLVGLLQAQLSFGVYKSVATFIQRSCMGATLAQI